MVPSQFLRTSHRPVSLAISLLVVFTYYELENGKYNVHINGPHLNMLNQSVQVFWTVSYPLSWWPKNTLILWISTIHWLFSVLSCWHATIIRYSNTAVFYFACQLWISSTLQTNVQDGITNTCIVLLSNTAFNVKRCGPLDSHAAAVALYVNYFHWCLLPSTRLLFTAAT